MQIWPVKSRRTNEAKRMRTMRFDWPYPHLYYYLHMSIFIPSYTSCLYFSLNIGPNISFCKSVAVLSEIFKSFSLSCLTFSYVTKLVFDSGNLYSSNFLFSSVTFKIELYTSKLVKPIVQKASTQIGAISEKDSLDFLSLNLDVFLWFSVCLFNKRFTIFSFRK